MGKQMSCRRVRLLLEEYEQASRLGERLTKEQLAVGHHLCGCSSCRKALDDLVRMREAIAATAPVPSADFSARVLASIRDPAPGASAENARSPRPYGFFTPRRAGVLITAAMVLVVGTVALFPWAARQAESNASGDAMYGSSEQIHGGANADEQDQTQTGIYLSRDGVTAGFPWDHLLHEDAEPEAPAEPMPGVSADPVPEATQGEADVEAPPKEGEEDGGDIFPEVETSLPTYGDFFVSEDTVVASAYLCLEGEATALTWQATADGNGWLGEDSKGRPVVLICEENGAYTLTVNDTVVSKGVCHGYKNGYLLLWDEIAKGVAVAYTLPDDATLVLEVPAVWRS